MSKYVGQSRENRDDESYSKLHTHRKKSNKDEYIATDIAYEGGRVRRQVLDGHADMLGESKYRQGGHVYGWREQTRLKVGVVRHMEAGCG